MVYSFMQFLHFRLALAVLFDSVSVPIQKFVVCAESARTRTARGKVSTTEKRRMGEEFGDRLRKNEGRRKKPRDTSETRQEHRRESVLRASSILVSA